MEPIIEINNVNLWYEKGKPIEVHALNNITLKINKGDYAAFFGPSGCGKTSILYAISGIDKVQDGTVRINNQDISALNDQELAIFRQAGIGIVFQQFNLIPSLSVLKNVSLPMLFAGASSKEADARASKLLERLDLTQYAHRYPFELSGGQQQRVGIARALANDPPIIIADEPLGNLDSNNAQKVLAFLKELNEKDGRTVIMVTHEAWSLRDVKTIFHMRDGAVTGAEAMSEGMVAEALSKHLYDQLTVTGNAGAVGEENISARVLANFLLRGYSMDEIERFESFVMKRFENKLTHAEFLECIHKPFIEGGVGLWKKKAERVVAYIEDVLEKRKEVNHIYEIIEKHQEISLYDEVKNIREWLLQGYAGKLTGEQIEALDQVITDRLRKYISKEHVVILLKLSKNRNGVGLSFRAAQIISEKLELVLQGEENITPQHKEA